MPSKQDKQPQLTRGSNPTLGSPLVYGPRRPAGFTAYKTPRLPPEAIRAHLPCHLQALSLSCDACKAIATSHYKRNVTLSSASRCKMSAVYQAWHLRSLVGIPSAAVTRESLSWYEGRLFPLPPCRLVPTLSPSPERPLQLHFLKYSTLSSHSDAI